MLFVGRERELGLLDAQLERAERGEGGASVLVGEPGIGKTTTIERFAEAAGASGRARVLWGRCYEGDGAPAFWPWMQIIRACAADLPTESLSLALGSGASDVAALLPELSSEQPSSTRALPGDADADARFRLFDALTGFLKRSAVDRPLLLILDDLHGADESSLLLLRFLVRELRDARLMVVGSCRDAALGQLRPLTAALAELDREPWAMRLELGGLTEPDVGRLAALVSGAQLPVGVVRDIHRRTEGNPFFVTQIVRLNAAGPVGTGSNVSANPRSVQDAVLRRLDTVSEAGRTLLTLASVIGREFDLRTLNTVSDASPGRTLTDLGEVVSARLLTEVTDAPGRYRFVHALVPETLYATIGEDVRRRLHGQVGEALEQHDSAPFTELAWHFFQAALGGTHRAQAERYAVRAADRARDMHAYEVAVRYYGMAVSLLEGDASVAWRCDLALELAESLSRSGDTRRAREEFSRAADLAGEQRPERLARAALGYAGPTVTGGLVDATAVELMQRCLEVLDPNEVGWRARLLARLGMELHFTDQRDLREVLTSEAVILARGLADPRALASVISSRRYATWAPDNLDRRLGDSAEIVELGERVNDLELALQGYRWLIPDLAENGDAAALERAVHRCAVLADTSRQPVYRWYARVFETCLALLRGQLANAERGAAEALELGGRAQAGNAAIYHAAHLYVLRREQDRGPEITDLMLQIMARFPLPLYECWLTCLLAEAGRREEATARLDDLAASGFSRLRVNALWLGSFAALSDVCVALGDTDRGEQVYRRLQPYAARRAMVGVPVCLGSVSYYLGRLAILLDRPDDAERHLRDAAAADERMGAQSWLAWTQLAHAELLLGRETDSDHAHTLLASAGRTGNQLGLTRLTSQVSATTKRFTCDDTAPATRLSRRESEVLGLLAKGLSNKTIAAELVITVNTVERHLVSIYRKLGVTGRAAAAVYAIRQGGYP
jgi:DNA-binding CsgD family transcriptional regulator